MSPEKRITEEKRITDVGPLGEEELRILFSGAALEKIQEMAEQYGSAKPEDIVQKALDLLYTARDSKIILEDKTGRKKIIQL